MFIENWSEEAKKAIEKMSSREKDRLEAIVAMHVMVQNMNDESAYMTWIYLVPDEASDWDMIDFAVNDENSDENHLFNDAVVLFKKLWTNYASEEHGLYIGGKTY